MNKIGEILKSTREKRRLTLSQASDKIKVREEYLEKIENDKILSNDVFTIGYLRLYSQYLRVNIESLIMELKTGVSEIVEDSVEEVGGDSKHKNSLTFNKKIIFLVASATIALIISTFLFLNKPSYVKNSDVSPRLAEETPSNPKKNIKIHSNKVIERSSITKLSDSEFEVKNINQESGSIRVSVMDSTMVTFLDHSKSIIEEKFVELGDQISLPKGFKKIYVKTRIPLAIKIEDIYSLASSSS
jgi:cytoskeletal protein RodZ